MSNAPDTVAPLPGDRVRPARLGSAVAVVLLLLLVGGVSASIAAGVGVARAQQTDDRNAFEDSVTHVAASLETSLRRNTDLVATGRTTAGLTPGMTNPRFRQWFSAMDAGSRYPGVISLMFIRKVPAAQLPAFRALIAADPALTAGSRYLQVLPPGRRPYYCLPRLFVAVPNTQVPTSALPAGIDLCTINQERPFFGDGSTDRFSATPADFEPTLPPVNAQLTPSEKAALAAAQKNAIFINAPVYANGAVPGTVGGRRAATIGWISAWFDLDPLLADAVRNKPMSITLSHQNPGDAKAQVVASRGVTSGGRLTVELGLDADGPWTITVVGDAPAHGLRPVTLGWVIALCGLVATLLTVILVYVLAWSRRRALAMVQRRTAELRHQALHDKLTGLPNRTLVMDRATQLLARGRRQQLPVAALLVDLDNFKDINDTLGHGAGDELLQAVATRLIKTVRESDTVGRLGGDEFVVLTEAASLAAGPEVVAQRLIDVLQEPFHLGPSEAAYTVTASIGVAIGDRDSAADLLRDADVALYQAKAAGKNGYTVFHQRMQDEVESRLGTEMDLRFALDDEQFFLMYQPTFDIARVETTGAEALLRWRHPTRGVVPPVDFIPLLESNGLIVPVGLWVLREACRQGAMWRAAGYPTRISVNVSARQLETGSFTDDVARALGDAGLPADLLTVEITEATLMRDASATVDRLTSLKALGISLAIDDFGTGYSSLAYLRQFPVDILKIDRSFIATIAESYESTVLVHSLVQLGKTLGLEVVAEGVEDTTQLEHLQREQCDTGQGYLYSRPLTADQMYEFLAERAPTGLR
jgi:diguanylate cyclase (GGDEF)-like protein